MMIEKDQEVSNVKISKEEAILKNESSGNSYLILEPCKLNIFPNFLVGIIKCYYFINNEIYIGEGVGMLIGEDVIITSAHNLIFSEYRDYKIINYKPNKITFHVLNNGILEVIKPLNCDINSIIFSDNLKEIKFEKNYDLDYLQKRKFVRSFKKKSKIKNCQQSNGIKPFDNEISKHEKNNNQNDNNLNNPPSPTPSDDVKSKFSEQTFNTFTNRKNLKNSMINNISEISLVDDYAIIFTEIPCGKEILELFCDEKLNLKENFSLNVDIDNETKIFKIIEEHIDFIQTLEASDNQKICNSKISMVSCIKYFDKLIGIPQYVYGSNFNDLNSKFFKHKKDLLDKKASQKDLKTNFIFNENCKNKNNNTRTFYILDELNSNICLNKVDKVHPSFICPNPQNTHKWEKELSHCLLINFDKNSNRKNLRNIKLENLKKLNLFNNEEFYYDGKSVLSEAKGKLCSLIYDKNKRNNYKNTPTPFDGRYEVNVETSTPYFNRCSRNNDDKDCIANNINNKLEQQDEDENTQDISCEKSTNPIFEDMKCPDVCNKILSGDYYYNSSNLNDDNSLDKNILYKKIVLRKSLDKRKLSFLEKVNNRDENKEESFYAENSTTLMDREESINKTLLTTKLDKIKEENDINNELFDNFKKEPKYTICKKKDSKKIFDIMGLESPVCLGALLEIKTKNPSFSTNNHKVMKNEKRAKKKNDEMENVNKFSIEKAYRKTLEKENFEKNNMLESELNYMMTTYKGQSGSPLFIRIKNEKLIEMKKENLINRPNEKYSYIFLGLHSRSPENNEPITINPKNYLQSSALSRSNLQIGDNPNIVFNINNKLPVFNNTKTIDINIDLNDPQKNLNIKIDLKNLIEKEKEQDKLKDMNFLNDNSNMLLNNSTCLNNSINCQISEKEKCIQNFFNKNSYCSYNIGFKLSKPVLYKIKKSIQEYRKNKEILNELIQNKFSDLEDFAYNNWEKYNKTEILNNNTPNHQEFSILSEEVLCNHIYNNTRRISTDEGLNSFQYQATSFISSRKNTDDNNNYSIKPNNSIKNNPNITNKNNIRNDYNDFINKKMLAVNNLKNIDIESNYYLIYITIYEELIVCGIFNVTSKVEILFEIAARYLEIDKVYLQLKIENENLSYKSLGIEYIQKLFFKMNNSSKNDKIFKNIFFVDFTIDIEKYSDLISSKLYSKLSDNIKNFDSNILFDYSKNENLLKIVIKYIFNEIQCLLDKCMSLYGILFNAIKRKLISSS